MDQARFFKDADVSLHPELPLIAFPGLVDLGIPLPCLFLVEIGEVIKVASMILPFFMAIPLALRCAFTA